jgi:hypothetical protein
MAYTTRVCNISDFGVRAPTRALRRVLCGRLWSTPRLLLRWLCFLCGFDRDGSGADLSVATARSNGCRVEGQLDSDGVDVDGVFWSLRNMVELILVVCCCPCLVAAVAYVTKAHLRVLDVLDDCKDALMVCAMLEIARHARTCCCGFLSFSSECC